MSTLSIALTNQSTSSTVYAYITGQALQNNNALVLLESDGQTLYYPSNPSAVGSSLTQNVAISLGAPGTSRTVTIPQIAGGRIWFSIGSPITFKLNPGPALVEPSVTNQSDPNVNIEWDFCEFTFNSSQVYANITYVDFVSIPIALTLTSSSAATQHVGGMPTSGLQTVVSGLQAQTASDKEPWSSLIVRGSNGQPLRVLSPNNGIVMNSSMFSGYFDPYTNEVWTKYTGSSLPLVTQNYGTLDGTVANNTFNFAGSDFQKPTTADIFSCSTGPFATGSNNETNTIIPRLAAAFNRTTLLNSTSIPAPVANYYTNPITNHYARIVHAANVDGRGYSFPYDDVEPPSGADQSGFVNAGNPTLLTVTVGGANASATVSNVAEPQAATQPAQKPMQLQNGAPPPVAAAASSQNNVHPPAIAAAAKAAPAKPAGTPAAQKPVPPKKQSFFSKLKARFGSKKAT